MLTNYSLLRPEILSRYITFKNDEPYWNYTSGRNDMYNIQALGAARIWNLLLEHQIALLADEVGMGKTIQALAVMITLWRQNPKARILIYVPNTEIAEKWLKEYTNFIRGHYKPIDQELKSGVEDEPVKTGVYCTNHYDLLQKAKDKRYRLFVCKISSLSYMGNLSPEQLSNLSIKINYPKNCNGPAFQRVWMERIGQHSNKYLYRLNKGDVPFELLIVDESHNIRTINRTVNKSISAKALFKREKWEEHDSLIHYPIAARTLLMTATPNHYSSEDIINTLGFFRPEIKVLSVEEILKKLCVRRFRRLQGMTKHNYRKEIADPVSLTSLPEKLFFAAYQKSLVMEQARKKESHAKLTQPYKILFGYLEGFEFLYRQTGYQDRYEDPDNDFETAADTSVLNNLVTSYREAYKTSPRHPKYDKLINELKPSDPTQNYLNEKALVFVRRIPSVFEISRRILSEYDAWFILLLEKHLPKDMTASLSKFKNQNNWPRLRKYFNSLRTKEEPFLAETVDEVTEGPQGLDNIPFSYVLDLFVIKKNQGYNSTDCSNFRIRLTRKESIFSLFFQPALDYRQQTYFTPFARKKNDKSAPYLDVAKTERFCQLEDPLNSHFLDRNQLSPFDRPAKKSIRTSPDTLMGLWWKNNGPDNQTTEKARQTYINFQVKEREAFALFLMKGILQASPFIVHLYCYFKSVEVPGQNISTYRKFCTKVSQTMTENGLHRLISDAILSYSIFYHKEMALNMDEALAEKWNFLNATIPVYPYCSFTKRSGIIRSFNTPFFPNVLVATSVLQEGVDLHYHCSKIIHYGIAFTPGDNEQRIGRVDRMMGKLDQQLSTNDPKIHLPIHYPYLAGTLDEDQISRFIKRKYKADLLIDHLKDARVSKEIDLLDDIEKDDWKRYFRKPEPGKSFTEPYGVEDAHFDGIPYDPE